MLDEAEFSNGPGSLRGAILVNVSCSNPQGKFDFSGKKENLSINYKIIPKSGPGLENPKYTFYSLCKQYHIYKKQKKNTHQCLPSCSTKLPSPLNCFFPKYEVMSELPPDLAISKGIFGGRLLKVPEKEHLSFSALATCWFGVTYSFLIKVDVSKFEVHRQGKELEEKLEEKLEEQRKELGKKLEEQSNLLLRMRQGLVKEQQHPISEGARDAPESVEDDTTKPSRRNLLGLHETTYDDLWQATIPMCATAKKQLGWWDLILIISSLPFLPVGVGLMVFVIQVREVLLEKAT